MLHLLGFLLAVVLFFAFWRLWLGLALTVGVWAGVILFAFNAKAIAHWTVTTPIALWLVLGFLGFGFGSMLWHTALEMRQGWRDLRRWWQS